MAKMIKIKCNGPNRRLNEVDLDTVLERTIVTRGVVRGSARSPAAEDLPERAVRPCRECTVGKVVITREMIEEALGS